MKPRKKRFTRFALALGMAWTAFSGSIGEADEFDFTLNKIYSRNQTIEVDRDSGQLVYKIHAFGLSDRNDKLYLTLKSSVKSPQMKTHLVNCYRDMMLMMVSSGKYTFRVAGYSKAFSSGKNNSELEILVGEDFASLECGISSTSKP